MAEPTVIERLDTFRAGLAAEYAKIEKEGDPLILDPPATVDELIAELATR